MGEETEKRDRKAKRIADLIYVAYGTGSGILLGIPANLRVSVEEVIKITLNLAGSVSDEEGV